MEIPSVFEQMLEKSANNIVERNLDHINTDDVEIIPCNNNVLVQPYETNPYRRIDTTESGIVIGIESDKTYKSEETGEITQNNDLIRCGKVLSIGPDCRNVNVGDDIFYTTYSMTLIPFRKMGYVMVTENLIICRIVKK